VRQLDLEKITIKHAKKLDSAKLDRFSAHESLGTQGNSNGGIINIYE